MSFNQVFCSSDVAYRASDISILRHLADDLQLEKDAQHPTSWIDYADKIPSRYSPRLLPHDLRAHTERGRLVNFFLTSLRPQKCMVISCGEILSGFHAIMVSCFFSSTSRLQECAMVAMRIPAQTFGFALIWWLTGIRHTKDRNTLNVSVQSRASRMGACKCSTRAVTQTGIERSTSQIHLPVVPCVSCDIGWRPKCVLTDQDFRPIYIRDLWSPDTLPFSVSCFPTQNSLFFFSRCVYGRDLRGRQRIPHCRKPSNSRWPRHTLWYRQREANERKRSAEHGGSWGSSRTFPKRKNNRNGSFRVCRLSTHCQAGWWWILTKTLFGSHRRAAATAMALAEAVGQNQTKSREEASVITIGRSEISRRLRTHSLRQIWRRSFFGLLSSFDNKCACTYFEDYKKLPAPKTIMFVSMSFVGETFCKDYCNASRTHLSKRRLPLYVRL